MKTMMITMMATTVFASSLAWAADSKPVAPPQPASPEQICTDRANEDNMQGEKRAKFMEHCLVEERAIQTPVHTEGG